MLQTPHTVSDSTYQAQEELLFRTATRLKGVLFYRLPLLVLLPMAAALSVEKITAPAVFWTVFAAHFAVNGLNIAINYLGFGQSTRARWFIVADAACFGALAETSGGVASHFALFYFLLILYSITWFDRHLSLLTGVLAAMCVLLLWGLAAPSADPSDTIVLVAGLLALAVGSGEIAKLVADTRERIVHSAMGLIAANKRIIGHQDALRESEERVRLILDSAAEGIFGVDMDGNCTFANRSCAKLLGYPDESALLGCHMHQLAHHTYPNGRPYPERICRVRHATRQGKSTHCSDEVHWRADGTSFPVEYWSHPIRRDGQVVGSVVTFVDISERKRAEEALHQLNLGLEDRVEQRTRDLATANAHLNDTLNTLQKAQGELVRSEKLASLGSLVAGVAHELNTPLGNSLTVASTLADYTRDFAEEAGTGRLRRSSLSEFVDEAFQATDLLVRNLLIASDLISRFKRVAVDQTSAQRRPFDLEETLNEVLITLRPLFKKTPHRLETEFRYNAQMDSFPGPLGQVVTNLVSNALIHGFKDQTAGLVRIVVSEGPSNDWVRLEVADNGCGIPVDQQLRVFDPFFTTKLGQGGSGLGLHIVHNTVIKILGGRITVDSRPGSGTSFSLELPLVAPYRSKETVTTGMAVAESDV